MVESAERKVPEVRPLERERMEKKLAFGVGEPSRRDENERRRSELTPNS